MKNVIVCLVCYDVTVDDRSEMSLSEVTKLMLIAKFNPKMISIEKHVCPNCRIFSPQEYCDKVLKNNFVETQWITDFKK